MELRVVIADDEPLARDLLEAVLLEDPNIELMAACASGHEAIEKTIELRPDLIFLDIEMPEMTGLEVAVTLIEKMGLSEVPQIIFATAYDRYAVQAFRVNAVDYVLKPLNDADVSNSLARARRVLKSGQGEQKTHSLRDMAASSQIKLQDGDKIILVPRTSLICAKAQGDYVALFAEGRTRLIRATLKSVEAKLPISSFQRIHRSAVVNLAAVREVTPAAKGAATVYLSNGMDLPVSRAYAAALKRRLSE